MKCSGLVPELILDVDDDSIANLSGHNWNWPFAVDSNCWSFERAIRICVDPSDVKVVCDSTISCFCDEAKGKKQH